MDGRNRSARVPTQPPAAMFDMGGLADDAFGQDDLVRRPADRRQFQRAEGLRTQPVAAIVDRDMRFGGGAVHDRRLLAQQMVHQRLLERSRLSERIARAQRHRLAVLDPVEAEREGRRGEAVQRGDLRLNLRRRLGHDVEGVPGAHGS